VYDSLTCSITIQLHGIGKTWKMDVNGHGKSWKMHIKGPDESWKTTLIILYAL